MAGVQLRGVVKTYGSTTAVSDIDIDIAEGEFIVLLGPSGCGKTTTLRCIAGLESISDGEILMDGKLLSAKGFSVPPEQREIGMVFQSYAIWPHMTVGENVAFGLKLKKLSKPDIAAGVTQALETVGLGAFDDRSASELSGGQQQRVALARAIALEPRVLLFDEPLSNLDAKLRERMRFELRQLHKRLGITSIYVTHDQQEAMVIADRVILMNAGRIDQVGSPDDIYQRPASRFGAEFIGLANIMAARVLDGDHQSTRIALESGPEFTAAIPRPPVEQVDVVCRPENVIVSLTQLAGPNVLVARVTAIYSPRQHVGRVSAGGRPVDPRATQPAPADAGGPGCMGAISAGGAAFAAARKMMRHTCFILALIAGGLATPSLPAPARSQPAQSFPAPNEQNKLYEGAKKEGSLVWYGGAPLEPMQGMANAFAAKYPGVKVQIIRIVGVAQYQRYLQETQAGQHIVDVLHVGDEPSMADLVDQGYIVDWKVPTLDRVPLDARIKTHAYASYIIDGAIGYNPTKGLARRSCDFGAGLERHSRSPVQGTHRDDQPALRRTSRRDRDVSRPEIQGSIRVEIPQGARRTKAGRLQRRSGAGRPCHRRRARHCLVAIGRHHVT